MPDETPRITDDVRMAMAKVWDEWSDLHGVAAPAHIVDAWLSVTIAADALDAEVAALTAQRDAAPMEGLQLAAISRWVDEHPANAQRDREAAAWGRVAKVGEECGEVVAAMIAATGQNPRKGQSGCMDDVVKELLDVAVTALAAVEHFGGNDGGSVEMLAEHLAGLIERAGLSPALAGASPVAADPPEQEPKRHAGAFFDHIEKYGSPAVKAAARRAEQELAADPPTEEQR